MRHRLAPAQVSRSATSPQRPHSNPAALAARLSGADRAALWLVSRDASPKCIWSQGFGDDGLRKERTLIDQLRHAETILAGQPLAVQRPESFDGPSAKRETRAGGWCSMVLWPIQDHDSLLRIVACYFGGASPPNGTRLRLIQTLLQQDAAPLANSPPRLSRSLQTARPEQDSAHLDRAAGSDTGSQVFRLMLDVTRLALPRCADVLVALGPSEASPFIIVAGSGVFHVREGLRYPSVGVLASELEANSCEREPAGAASCWGSHPRALPARSRGGNRFLLAPLMSRERQVGSLMALGTQDSHDPAASAAVLNAIAKLGSAALERLEGQDPLEDMLAQVVVALAAAAQAHDGYTGDHSNRLVPCAEEVARRLGCLPHEVDEVRWGAMLHDIGKIAIPDPILLKPGPLSEEEWAIVRQHPAVGERIVSAVHGLRRAAEFVRHHQERFDGQGYPDALQGERIPLGSRILAVVDSYGAIRDRRPYKPPRSHAEAVAEIRRCQGSQFDPRVVAVFLDVLQAHLAEPSPPSL